MKETIYHLLIKGEHRVWCRRNQPVGKLNITNLPSKCNCVNCLTDFRFSNRGKGFSEPWRKAWTDRWCSVRLLPSPKALKPSRYGLLNPPPSQGF